MPGHVAEFARLLNGAVDTIDSDDLAIRSDGTRIWLHWRATAVRRRNGSFEHFVITFEDSTQKHLAEDAAHANLAELEKLNQMKTEFTSMVSHEFRTALTGIQGMSELIHGGDLEHRRGAASTAATSSRRPCASTGSSPTCSISIASRRAR